MQSEGLLGGRGEGWGVWRGVGSREVDLGLGQRGRRAGVERLGGRRFGGM